MQGRIIVNAREVGFAEQKFLGDVVVVVLFTFFHLEHRALAQLLTETLHHIDIIGDFVRPQRKNNVPWAQIPRVPIQLFDAGEGDVIVR